MKFFRAKLDTSHFDFEAFGETKERAKAALVAGMKKHAKEYRMSAAEAKVFLSEYTEEGGDICVYAVELGAAFRDCEPLTTSPGFNKLTRG